MSIGRVFWLWVAICLSIAALVAIAAILGGSFGGTQWKILGTLAAALLTGATAVAGLACLDRRVARTAGIAAVALALPAFLLWSAGIWGQADNEGLGQAAGLLAAWVLGLLLVTTLRLITHDERVVHICTRRPRRASSGLRSPQPS